MIRPALVAITLILATPALAQTPAAAPPTAPAPSLQRYQLDLEVIHNGVRLFWTLTQIVEGAPVEASATVNGVTYDFSANLFAVQGDGDEAQMMLEAHFAGGETELAAPRLTFLRDRMALIEVGDKSGDLLKMSIAPIR